MDAGMLDKMVDEVRTLLETRLGVRGRSLAHQLRRAGRLLPRARRRDGAALVQAQVQTKHPKLARTLDPARLRAARDRLVAHLGAIDPGEERLTRRLRFAAGISFNLLIVGALLTGVLVWRGFL